MNANTWPFPGARWWKLDFHTHTPASSDYGAGPNQDALRARSHREWITDFLDAGIQCIAVTDHNCGDWIDPLKTELEKMRAEGIAGSENFHLFPGVELTINGAHYLAIFDPSASTRTIQDLLAVAGCNNDAQNAQAYCSESIGTVCTEVLNRGGLFIPAHVDEENTGAFKIPGNHSALDPILNLEGVVAMEVRNKDFELPALYRNAKLDWTSVLGSDAHHPQAPTLGTSVARPSHPGSHFTWVKMAEPSLEALRLALIDGEGISIRRSDETEPRFEPYQVPDDMIEEIAIAGARYMGRGAAEVFRFSPWLNALIGGRGSGKSTALQFLRLALRRDKEVMDLPPASLPRTEFERFRKISRNRHDDGAIKDDTRIRLIYRHGGIRYRISWPELEGASAVEEWNDEARDWQPASSQEVRERFPVRLFSQGQIATMAGARSGALLGLIDQAVGYTDWKTRWDEKERGFLTLRNRARELEGKLQSRDRIVGQLEDVRRKLKRFEEAGHAEVLKKYRVRRGQMKEVQQQGEEARAFAKRIGELADQILPSNVPEGLFGADDALGQEALLLIQTIRASVEAAAKALKGVESDLSRSVDEAAKNLRDSKWNADVEEAKKAYEKLVEELHAQGVKNPNEYGGLVQDRQRLEKEVKAFDSLKQQLDSLREQAEATLVELTTLRREISEKREGFLQDALVDNDYVRIELQRYGREPFAARDSLRVALGIDGEPDKFEQDIFRRAENDGEADEGMIAKLLAELPNEKADEEMERRLIELRSRLAGVSSGGDSSQIGGHLKNRLHRSAEQRPEFVDRILTWFPEDSLSVSYSPKGDGQNFRSIQQGSAGQRAAAMLAFLLAYGNEPIVVDQPEDDLDNHLIYRLVVQQMRANKQRRQIITVTHNPNIVVNGDAEMVHALDFFSGQCKVIKKGSLQDAPVRTEICRVMEGGEDAFEQRYRRIGKGGRHV